MAGLFHAPMARIRGMSPFGGVANGIGQLVLTVLIPFGIGLLLVLAVGGIVLCGVVWKRVADRREEARYQRLVESRRDEGQNVH